MAGEYVGAEDGDGLLVGEDLFGVDVGRLTTADSDSLVERLSE